MEATLMQQILIIKHGALGDFILCSGVLKTIREAHKHAHITLLTTKPFVGLLEQSGLVDTLWVDSRPKLWQVAAFLSEIKRLRSVRFDRVYDLQTSDRSSLYFKLLPSPKPEFSGIAQGASHRHHSDNRVHMHTIDRQAEQLRIAGIEHVYPPDISWMKGSAALALPHVPYALIVAGGSAHRPEKRYPASHYMQLCGLLLDKGITPCLIGGGAEADLLANIASFDARIINLCNATTYNDIAEIARHANLAVGNDTGPMHIIAATGCPSVVLFSHASNPDLCAPRGEDVHILRHEILGNISPEQVMTHCIKYI
jgi:ADP-heptose:LPS heptosyltransferase